MAIFVFGDEYQSDNFDGFLKEVDRGVARRTAEGASLRIHAIGFWNQGYEALGVPSSASSRNFGILMRELTRRHQGRIPCAASQASAFSDFHGET